MAYVRASYCANYVVRGHTVPLHLSHSTDALTSGRLAGRSKRWPYGTDWTEPVHGIYDGTIDPMASNVQTTELYLLIWCDMMRYDAIWCDHNVPYENIHDSHHNNTVHSNHENVDVAMTSNILWYHLNIQPQWKTIIVIHIVIHIDDVSTTWCQHTDDVVDSMDWHNIRWYTLTT